MHQMNPGIELYVEGRKICGEMWAGITAAATRFVAVVERTMANVPLRETCVVAGRVVEGKEASEALAKMAQAVCLNDEGIHDRAAIVKSLGNTFISGDQSLVENNGCSRFFKSERECRDGIGEKLLTIQKHHEGFLGVLNNSLLVRFLSLRKYFRFFEKI